MSVALTSPLYIPALRVISAITQATTASVTTSFAHGYISGTIVRLIIPITFGMVQANQLFGPITVTGNTTFTLPINTSGFDAFAIPMGNKQEAQCVPFAEINSILTAAMRNALDPTG